MQCILSKAIDEGAIQISVTRKICSCDFCGELYALPIVSYLFNGIEHKLYASCPHCSRAGTDKRKENTIFVCPECGEIVEQQYAGHWDWITKIKNIVADNPVKNVFFISHGLGFFIVFVNWAAYKWAHWYAHTLSVHGSYFCTVQDPLGYGCGSGGHHGFLYSQCTYIFIFRGHFPALFLEIMLS